MAQQTDVQYPGSYPECDECWTAYEANGFTTDGSPEQDAVASCAEGMGHHDG
jgi:hypothetical protein